MAQRIILPNVGACAVLTIDPLATLDSEVREDAEAVAACKRLVTKKYAVLVADRLSLYAPNAAYNPCIVNFLLQGEPAAFPERGIEPSMSLPMCPMTMHPHPSSREPMQASQPLPWNDCYITSFSFADVRSPTAFTEEPVMYMFERKEMHRLDRLLSKDVEKAKAARLAQGSVSFPPPSSATINNPNGKRPVPKGVVTATFTHDLSTMEELTDPSDYFREVEAIARIEEEAWPRIAKAKARATQEAATEAARIDAQVYDDHTVKLLVEHETSRARTSRVASKMKTIARNIGRRIFRVMHLDGSQ
ncbi:hypothetical protein C8R46DRAFT_287932 [Mycena filopes]|nr:hypothetical protein C8R46DRAFT_287932 [Mycena filopes]